MCKAEWIFPSSQGKQIKIMHCDICIGSSSQSGRCNEYKQTVFNFSTTDLPPLRRFHVLRVYVCLCVEVYLPQQQNIQPELGSNTIWTLSNAFIIKIEPACSSGWVGSGWVGVAVLCLCYRFHCARQAQLNPAKAFEMTLNIIWTQVCIQYVISHPHSVTHTLHTVYCRRCIHIHRLTNVGYISYFIAKLIVPAVFCVKDFRSGTGMGILGIKWEQLLSQNMYWLDCSQSTVDLSTPCRFL